MTPKEYLSQVRSLDRDINTRQQERDAIMKTLIQASKITDDPIVPNNNTSPVEGAVEKLMQYNDELNNDIDRLVNLKINTSLQIGELEDSRHRNVLTKYYLCDLTWEQIAVDMSYGIRHIYKLHGEALENFRKKHGMLFQ